MAKIKGFDALPENIKSKLQDLSALLKEVTIDKDAEGWVYKYRSKSELSAAIYEDFIKYNEIDTNKTLSFIFSDEITNSGILSCTQAFQTLAILVSKLGLKTTAEHKKLIKKLFSQILNTVCKEDGGYLLDASPYLPNSDVFKKDNYKYAYIDTITWVMSSLLSAYRLHINKQVEFNEEELEMSYKLFNYCINYLNDSFIEDKDVKHKLAYGWNYTKDCEQVSLYFTFAVSEVLIDVLNTFENVIRAADIDYISQEIDKKYESVEGTEEQDLKKEQVASNYAKHKEYLESDEGKLELAIFKKINNELNVYDDESPYRVFEDKCKKAANRIWETVRGGLNVSFYSADLSTIIDENSFEKSITNDGIFNLLFIINIIINAGIDEDYDDNVNFFAFESEKEAAIDAYDEIRDALRFAYDNAYLAYTKLEKKGKEYKVNEYTLSFDERFDAHKEDVKEMRKAHIRVFSLMPLLVKAKTTMGEFVIRYPQYDMQIYLENILYYRLVNPENAEEQLWIWEKNGYSSSSNFYFVSALSDFYSYYETYEENAIKNINNNKKREAQIKENYLNELRQPGNEIANLNVELANAKEEIEKLTQTLTAQQDEYAKLKELYENDPLRKVFTEFVQKAIFEYLCSDNLGLILQEISKSLFEKALVVGQNIQNSEEVAPKSELENQIEDFGMALVSKKIVEAQFESHKGKNYTFKDSLMPNIYKMIKEDINKALLLYFTDVSGDGMSDYVQTKGFEYIKETLSKARENKNNKE